MKSPPQFQASPLSVYATAEENPVPCHGDHTDLAVQALGGKEPYEIAWENLSTGEVGNLQILDFQGGTVLPDMSPGNYLFSIEDAFDSTGQYNLVVSEPPTLTIEVEAFPASCQGSLDGVAFVDEVHGGTVAGDYQYFWNTNPGVSSSNIGFLDPGIYSVTVSDDNGCSATGSAEVLTFGLIFLNPRITEISCHGANDGILDLYPVGINPPFTYQWTSNVSTGDFSSAWQLGPGFYSVTVTDNSGVCFETAEFTLTEPPAIEVDYRLTEPVCYGDPGFFEILAVANAAEPWQASIVGVQDFSDLTQFEIEPGLPHRLVIRDEKGCEISEDFLIPGKQRMELEVGENQRIKYGERLHFDPVATPTAGIVFEWSPAEGLSCTDCLNPVAEPHETTTYTLKMNDADGCTLEDALKIEVYKSRDVYIPNAFSPNYDGFNDLFCPYGGFEVVSVKSFQIFDRWGGLLYDNQTAFPLDDVKSGWDGSSENKPLDTGAYLYQMNIEFIDGEVVLFAGEINLMR